LKYAVLRSISLPFTNTVGVEFTFAFAPASATFLTQSEYPPLSTHSANLGESIPAAAPMLFKKVALIAPAFSAG
jgi:hypothetical protein